MEANIGKGILNLPTRTELVVMALYQEAVSLSSSKTIRGPGLEESNALYMGPFLQ